jgi:uncharacterized membrane protein
MDIFEYAVGIGGWFGIAYIVNYVINGVPHGINPIALAFMPCITIMGTYAILLIIQNALYVIYVILRYMFRGEVILIILSCITSAAAIFVITSTYGILNAEHERQLINVPD